MIKLTKKAACKIKEIAKMEGLNTNTVRVKVAGGGCSGFVFEIFYEENPILEMDEIFESFDVKIICDPLSFQYLDGTEIDYIEKDFMSGFKFINPHITSTCACGSSVSF